REFPLYIRPPKPLQPGQAFGLPGAEEGQYDLRKTFFGGPSTQETVFLHVLARRKAGRPATKKGAPPPPTTPRGDFETDVLGALTSFYTGIEELQTPKFEDVNQSPNRFRRLKFKAPGDNDVQVYFYGKSNDPFQGALIWIVPSSQLRAFAPKMDLC